MNYISICQKYWRRDPFNIQVKMPSSYLQILIQQAPTHKEIDNLKNGKVKVELALAKGKKLHDKHQDLAKKDAQRTIERELRGKY